MPWATFEQDSQYCVYKVGEDREKTGESLGCHPSREKAQAQVAALYAGEGSKAGARHSTADRTLIKGIHDRANEIKSAAVELGHELEQIADAKATGIPAVDEPVIWASIKAVGDGWELDVLAVPFGGPNDGKDAHGEYFDRSTNTYKEQFPTPLVVYYHGFTPEGKPQGEPVIIGKARYSRTDEQGHWYRIVLNKAVAFAKRVRDAALKNLARASTGTIAHLKRVARDGRILNWAVAEISLFDIEGRRQPANDYAVALPTLKAHYAKAGMALPSLPPQAAATGATSPANAERNANPSFKSSLKVIPMTPEEIQAVADAAVAAEQEEHDAAEAAQAEQQRIISETVKIAVAQQRVAWQAETKQVKAQAVKANRLPVTFTAPHVNQFSDVLKYSHLGVDDLAFLCGVLDAAKRRNYQNDGISQSALKALAIKIAEDKGKLGDESRAALKAGGIEPADVLDGMKANELNYSSQVGFGDEWVGTEYSRRLWDAIRAGTYVLTKLPTIEVPEGMESVVVPLEAADPTWYKVAQTTDEDATSKRPNATVPSSKLATANGTLVVAKMGARTQYSGEMAEDSLIPWAAQLRKQIETSGSEQLEHAIIDGDTAAGASANINHIGGTPGANDLFLLFNGFRKSPLVTTTANSRSAAGALVDTDFLETLYLMGTAGLNVQDQSKVDFIIDPNVHKKALTLASVKTRDVFTAATLEAGKITGIWGYTVRQSFFMHFKSTVRKANTAGKVDQTTTANNTTGSILAVRYDQWLFGYKRRMTIKLQEWIDADVTQIVALARVGLLQRDTEASAITYNVGI
jgi:hypothetical protein